MHDARDTSPGSTPAPRSTRRMPSITPTRGSSGRGRDLVDDAASPSAVGEHDVGERAADVDADEPARRRIGRRSRSTGVGDRVVVRRAASTRPGRSDVGEHRIVDRALDRRSEAAATGRAHHEAVAGGEVDAGLPSSGAPRRCRRRRSTAYEPGCARSTAVARPGGGSSMRSPRTVSSASAEQLDHRSRCRGRRATARRRRSRAAGASAARRTGTAPRAARPAGSPSGHRGSSSRWRRARRRRGAPPMPPKS